MKLIPIKRYIKKVRKMSDDKLMSQLYTTNLNLNLDEYKIILEEELLKRRLSMKIEDRRRK